MSKVWIVTDDSHNVRLAVKGSMHDACLHMEKHAKKFWRHHKIYTEESDEGILICTVKDGLLKDTCEYYAREVAFIDCEV